MKRTVVASLSCLALLAVSSSLPPASAEPAPESARGRKGPWVQCPPRAPALPRRVTHAYSAADERRMAELQAEVIARVEEMNAIVRRTTGKPAPTGPVVQFTLFTGCPDDPESGAMMEFIQRPETGESVDSFFDIVVDVPPDGGGGGGGSGGSGGCHCEANMVSCEGSCPC